MTNYYDKEGNVYKGLKSLVAKVMKDIIKENKEKEEEEEYNPYLLSGEELKRTEEARKRGKR